MAPAPYTLRSSFESSFARRGALVRQVVARLSTGLALETSLASDEFVWIPRLSAGLALASDECVWNGRGVVLGNRRAAFRPRS